MVRLTPFFLISSTLISATAIKKQTPSVQALSDFQTAWDKIKTYTASFKQKTTSLGYEEVLTEGRIYIKKPEKIRWDSVTDDTIQILNGKNFCQIQENKKRGNRTIDIFSDFDARVSKPFLFLTGKAQFTSLYKPKLLKSDPKTMELELAPLKKVGETLIAEIDKESYLLRSLAIEDSTSKVRIEFLNVETNPELDDAFFEYQKRTHDVVHKE